MGETRTANGSGSAKRGECEKRSAKEPACLSLSLSFYNTDSNWQRAGPLRLWATEQHTLAGNGNQPIEATAHSRPIAKQQEHQQQQHPSAAAAPTAVCETDRSKPMEIVATDGERGNSSSGSGRQPASNKINEQWEQHSKGHLNGRRPE